MKEGSEYTAKDIFWLSVTALGYVLIPIVIIIIVSLLCIFLTR